MPVSSLEVQDARLAEALSAARAALERRAREIDDLNVFPVADGDTGTNMLITARAVEVAAREAGGASPSERADTLSRAALMGARGNSGMILSQLVRGAAESLAGGSARGGAAVAAAARAASDAARAAVREPVEGTMLTVAHRIAVAAEAAADEGDAEPLAVLDAALAGGHAGLAETPSLLALLREAGVVDSGGLGLVVLLEGLVAALAGREPPGGPGDVGTGTLAPAIVEHAPSRYRYCTSFLLEGARDLAGLESELAELGDSLLVMGDAVRAKVHLHTDEPERAAALAEGHGAVDGLAFEDMRRQEAERDARLRARRAQAYRRAPARCGALCLAEGGGARELLEGLGARSIAPPRPNAGTAAPEVAAALGDALRALDAREALVLAPDPAWHGAAREAVRGHEGAALVLALDSLPAALAALVGFDPDRDAAGNQAEMEELAGAVRAAAVDASPDGDLRTVLERALRALGPAELVTVLVGANAGVGPADVEGWVRAQRPGAEVEAHLAGQAAPALIVGVE